MSQSLSKFKEYIEYNIRHMEPGQVGGIGITSEQHDEIVKTSGTASLNYFIDNKN
ncbi:MAG: hypothetical protein ACEPOW_13340 [Bacteroidales bacterium]